jgi:hypothetical protein
MNPYTHTHSNDPVGGSAALCGLDPSGIVDESAITEAATLAQLLEESPLEAALEELETMNARLRVVANQTQRIGTQIEEQTSAIRDQTTAAAHTTQALYEIARHLDRMIDDGRKARHLDSSVKR